MIEKEVLQSLVEDLKEIAYQAGKVIMEVYNSSDYGIQSKEDESPLTIADQKANDVIMEGLAQLKDQFPIISEENKEVPFEIRKDYQAFWMVDPLDGTKEFIKRNGEFTVNIALISEGKPVFGVVFAPVLDEMYWGVKGDGAFLQKNGEVTKLAATQFKKTDEGLKIVCSRSHLNERTAAFISSYGRPEKVACGSSLKFLIMAKGEAHIYPRLAPCMEWDTAAAQIILEEAGGQILSVEDNEALKYNKKSMLNPHFVAYANLQS